MNCWIAGRGRAEAEALAREVIREEGWRVEVLNEVRPITRAAYDGGRSPVGLARFEQAEADGDCFEFHTYPASDAD